MADKRDYYEVLGVSKNASDAELKKSFRRMAMKFHPDRNPDNAAAEEHFKEAKEAYDVLSDQRKRAAYDQFGHAGVEGAGGAGGGFGGAGFREGLDARVWAGRGLYLDPPGHFIQAGCRTPVWPLRVFLRIHAGTVPGAQSGHL